jgi:CRP-like cAMP-binding protein
LERAGVLLESLLRCDDVPVNRAKWIRFVTWAAIVLRVEPRVAAALGQRLRSMDYLPGQVIFAEGEPGDRLYAIAAGKVKIARRSPDGRQNLQTVLGPWDIFGELSEKQNETARRNQNAVSAFVFAATRAVAVALWR